MDLVTLLNDELKQLAGFAGPPPKRVSLTDDQGMQLTIDFMAVDTLGCSFRELILHVPQLVGRELKILKQWADDLSRRVTYLLENIGPVEIDKLGDKILIRSTPPGRSRTTAKFYEVLLSARSNGTFSLKRFAFEPGQPGRDAVDIQLTHEVLNKLISDLLDTVPA